MTIAHTRLQVLAEFRCTLRQFLQFSEAVAVAAGLQPQQHQLLLQIAGAPESEPASIRYVASRLGLRHNTAVELCTRCVQAGLIERSEAPFDRRSVLLSLTPAGQAVLGSLSAAHARELNDLAPELIRTLTSIQAMQ